MNMDIVTIQTCPPPGRHSLLARLRLAITLRRHRRQLREMDRHLLRDIGLTEAEARMEAEKPFWDVPQHWLR